VQAAGETLQARSFIFFSHTDKCFQHVAGQLIASFPAKNNSEKNIGDRYTMMF
jgi:hypothetical protein